MPGQDNLQGMLNVIAEFIKQAMTHAGAYYGADHHIDREFVKQFRGISVFFEYPQENDVPHNKGKGK
jgi:hypothetical protein